MTRTQIKARIRAARKTAFDRRLIERTARHWEASIYPGANNPQSSGLQPVNGLPNWGGDMCDWQTVLDTMMPGESADIWCYSDAFGVEGELRDNLYIWLNTDGSVDIWSSKIKERVRVVPAESKGADR